MVLPLKESPKIMLASPLPLAYIILAGESCSRFKPVFVVRKSFMGNIQWSWALRSGPFLLYPKAVPVSCKKTEKKEKEK